MIINGLNIIIVVILAACMATIALLVVILIYLEDITNALKQIKRFNDNKMEQ